MYSNSEEQTQTPGNPVCGGDMRKVIQCLIDWLEHYPNDEKTHLILEALAEESLKKAEFSDNKRRFTGEEIVEAVFENSAEEKPDNPNKWISWNRTVLKSWKINEKQIIDLARKRGLKFYPKPDRISTKGYHKAVYLIRAEPLRETIIETDLEASEDQSDKPSNEQQDIVYYEVAENGEVKPAWGVQWLLHDGEIRLSKRRMWAIFIGLFMLFASIVAISYISWILLSVPKPITTRDLTTLISIFVFPYAVWIFWIKPWLRLFYDRIVPAPELLVSFDEKSAQLELFKDGDLRLIRLVRYTAPCPICGATLHLEDGSPDYLRRLVGRCYDSPREHVFSFDRVTRKGTVLRSPIV